MAPIVIPGKGYKQTGKGYKQTAVKPRAATDRTVAKPAATNKPDPVASYGPTSRVTNKKLEDKANSRLVGQSELDAIRKKSAAEAAAAAAAAGGDGGGGRNPLNDYTQQLQSLLRGGSYADPYNGLLEKIKGLYGTAQTDLTTNQNAAVSSLEGLYGDQTSSLAGINTQAGNTINSSMDSLKTMLEGQANPYANLQAESVTPTAQLSSFLQGQNVGNQQTQDYAQVLNAHNAGSAGAFNNLASVMRSIAGANQQGAISDVAVQRDASTRQLANQNAAAGTQLKQGLLADKLKLNQGYQQNQFDLSKGLLGAEQSVQQNSQSQQSDLIQQLMAAIAKGGVPKKGRLF